MAVLLKEETALCHRHSVSQIEVKFTSAHSTAVAFTSATLSPFLFDGKGWARAESQCSKAQISYPRESKLG